MIVDAQEEDTPSDPKTIRGADGSGAKGIALGRWSANINSHHGAHYQQIPLFLSSIDENVCGDIGGVRDCRFSDTTYSTTNLYRMTLLSISCGMIFSSPPNAQAATRTAFDLAYNVRHVQMARFCAQPATIESSAEGGDGVCTCISTSPTTMHLHPLAPCPRV